MKQESDYILLLIRHSLYVDSLIKSHPLFRSVLFNKIYTPDSLIQPKNIYDILEFLIFKLFTYG